jgi:hypothetical protein
MQGSLFLSGKMMSLCRPAMRAAFVRCFAAVSAADVKVLRDRTGAPMLDCKEALKSCDGDTSKAIDWLRQKGISKGELGWQLVPTKSSDDGQLRPSRRALQVADW